MHLHRRITEFAAADAVVQTIHAPPATDFLHPLHFQIPTATRLTECCGREETGERVRMSHDQGNALICIEDSSTFPHIPHVYFACCEISNFFMFLRSDAP